VRPNGCTTCGSEAHCRHDRVTTTFFSRFGCGDAAGGVVCEDRIDGAGRPASATSATEDVRWKPQAAQIADQIRVAEARVITAIVGEDHPIFRDGVVHVLQEGGVDVVATAGDAPELIQKIRDLRPDVAIADIQMPPDRTDDGLRAVLKARASQKGLGVLLLSQFLHDRYALELVADGAEGVGYLLKEKVAEVGTLVDAVRRVAEGGTVLDPDVVAVLVGRRRKTGPLDELTKKEHEVLELIAQGRSNPGIAEQLVVTVGAIERHVARIYGKLGLHEGQGDHRRVLAVLEYLKQ
jgi:DNA-binding NarL/FixJ family response regulator